ncbi:MAG: sugar ABC transporter permease [Immundisolibacterales bacterium]|nr:sugar ABC transporter permease [Immundisolibacterales bacterium]
MAETATGRIPGHPRPRPRPRFDSRALTPYWFILPAVAVMAAGLVYPVLDALYLSFFNWKIATPFSKAEHVGLANYVRMLADPDVRESLWVTIRFGFWTITIEMVLGVALALMLEKPIRGASVFRTIFILPLMVSPVVVGLIWRYLFDARVGWINYYLGLWFGIEPQVWLGVPDLAFFAIVLTDIWQWTPFIFIIVIAGLQALPSEVLEASRIDGANWWQQTFLVKLPMIRSILIIALLMRLIDVFRALEVMYIMTGGGPGRATELLSLHIYNRAFDAQLLGYASAIAVLLIVIVFGLSAAILAHGNPMNEKTDV